MPGRPEVGAQTIVEEDRLCPAAACAEDGSSATYAETITTKSGVSVREIVSTGCPNHESYCTGKPANGSTCKGLMPPTQIGAVFLLSAY